MQALAEDRRFDESSDDGHDGHRDDDNDRALDVVM